MTDWLLHTLLATSELILIVLIVREPVRRFFGSRVAYGLWLIPLARLFMPTLTHTIERSVPAETTFHLSASEPVWMAHVAAPAPTLFEQLGGWPALALALWLTVAAALFLSRMIAFHRDRSAILRSSTGETLIGKVRLIRTPEISSPVALGILRPIIVVPLDFERLYGERERKLVLDHELAHHHSGDLVANLFAFVLLCLQWFNPLAWVAHAAFRFDQEAACDARVLDKAPAADRASYGRAIAKAASGRALLFASALDRPTSLQRRLQSMLRSPSRTRRIGGRVLIVTAIAAALPLTASHAVEYVITAAPAVPSAAAQSVPRAAMPVVAAVSAAAIQPAAVTRAAASSHYDVTSKDGEHFDVSVGPDASDEDMSINRDFVTIDGKKKRWEELTPAEYARVKAAVAKARTELANTHIDGARLQRDLANLPDQAKIAQMQSQLAATHAKLAESASRMDAKIAAARAAGRQPDDLELAISEKLRSLQNVDLSEAMRSLSSIDSKKIAQQVAGAQQSIERAKMELDQIQARIDADPRH